DVLGGSDDLHREPAIDRYVRAPELWELEVRIGHVQRIARRASACRDASVLRDVGRERGLSRVVDNPIADQHAGVANLIEYPHIRRTAAEQPRAASHLRLRIAGD